MLTPPRNENLYRPLTLREQMERDLKGIYDTVELDFFSDKSASWLMCRHNNSKEAMCFTFNFEGTHLNRFGLYKESRSGEEQIYSVHSKEDCKPAEKQKTENFKNLNWYNYA